MKKDYNIYRNNKDGLVLKIDMHNHTNISSRCSILDPNEFLKRAVELGLDGVCVTEHNTTVGGRKVYEMAKDLPLKIFVAQEVTTDHGDILAFGIFDEGLAGISITDLCELARQRNGVLVPAHPYRQTAFSLGESVLNYSDCFCAVEVLNGNCNEKQIHRASLLAESLKLPSLGGSDAHSLSMVGRYYTVFPREIKDEVDLVLALKEGGFYAEYNELWVK